MQCVCLTWLDRDSGFWCLPGYWEERCRGRSSGWSPSSVWSSHRPVTRVTALPWGSGTPLPVIGKSQMARRASFEIRTTMKLATETKTRWVPHQKRVIFAGYCHHSAVVWNLLTADPFDADVCYFFEIAKSLPLPKRTEQIFFLNCILSN